MKFALSFKLFVFSFLFILSGCETEITETDNLAQGNIAALSTESISNFLTSGSWKIKHFKINGEIAELDECVLDDLITFNVGGSFDYDPKVKCQDDEENFTGYWGIAKKANKVMLNLTGTASDTNEMTEYELKSINQKEAIVVEYITQRGQTFIFETTYGK